MVRPPVNSPALRGRSDDKTKCPAIVGAKQIPGSPPAVRGKLGGKTRLFFPAIHRTPPPGVGGVVTIDWCITPLCKVTLCYIP